MTEGRPLDPATRRYLLRTRAAMTERAGRDIRGLCLDPRWLLSSIITRPVGQVTEDLLRGDDPDLVRLGRLLERGAHLMGLSRSKTHLVNTLLLWLEAEPRFRPLFEGCVALLRRPYLRTLWRIDPSGTERTRTLRRHDAEVTSCVVSTDGKSLVTADEEGTVVIWDAGSGAFVGEADPHTLWENLGHSSDRPRSPSAWPGSNGKVSLLTEGDRLAVLTPPGLLGVWSLTGAPTPGYVIDTRVDGRHTAYLLSPGGQESFMTVSDEAFQLRSWVTGEVLLTMPRHEFSRKMAIDREGQIFVTEAESGLLDVWDLAAREHAARLRVAGSRVKIADFSVYGNLLVVGDFKGAARIWDWTRGTRLTTLTQVLGPPQIDRDAQVVRWLRRPGELAVTPIPFRRVRLAGTRAWIVSLWWTRSTFHRRYGSPVFVRLSEHMLATVINRTAPRGLSYIINHQVHVFDVRDGRALISDWGRERPINIIRGPQPDQLVVMTDTGVVETWDVASGATTFSRPAISAIGQAAASPDGSWLALPAGVDVHIVRPSEAQAPVYQEMADPIHVLADPGGRWLATFSDEPELEIWDPDTGQRKHYLTGKSNVGFRNRPRLRPFSPDGRWIGFTDLDDQILAYDAMSGRPLRGLRPVRPPAAGNASGNMVHAAAGPNGPIVVISYWGELTVWDVGAGRQLATPPSSRTTVVGDARGRWIAGIDADGQAFVWDVADGRLLSSPGPARTLVADPEGQWLYVLADHRLTVVDPYTNRRHVIRATDESRDDTAMSVTVSGDGGRCAFLRRDGGVEVLPRPGPDNPKPVLITRSRLTGLAGESHPLLSSTGRYLAVTGPIAGELELIDLGGGIPVQASVTLDGTIQDVTWLGSALAAVGEFGLRLVTLAR